MRAILDAQPHRKGNDFVFGRDQGGYSGWSASKAALDAQLPAAMPAWHLHDLRHAAVTGMCESPLSVPPHIAELVVNHQSGHRAGIAGHYNHANCIPERRDALEKWGRHVMALVKPKPVAKAGATASPRAAQGCGVIVAEIKKAPASEAGLGMR